jgi:hypothetical protein
MLKTFPLAAACVLACLAGSVRADDSRSSRSPAAMQAPALARPAGNGWINQPFPEYVILEPAVVDNVATLYLLGTRIQISHTGEGIPLPGSGAMSYIDFGPGTNDMGVADRGFDVAMPVRPLSQLAMGAIGHMSGGMFTAYQVRFKVNDLETQIDYGNFSAFLTDGAFGFELGLESPNPTIKCEADTLSMLPFGFPIPVGWVDDTCPDAMFSHPVLRIAFFPGLDAQGHIVIADVQVTLAADIDVSPIEFLDDYVHMKDQLRDGFASQLRDKLLDPELKALFAGMLQRMLEAQRGRPIGALQSLWIDSSGVFATVAR